MRSQGGFNLVGVMVGVGLLGLIGAGMSALFTSMSKSQANLRFRSQSDVFAEEVRQLLGSKDACANTFGGIALNASMAADVPDFKDGTASPGAVKYDKATVYGDGTLTISKITLDSYVDDIAPAGQATVRLALHQNGSGNNGGPADIARTIQIRTEKNAGGNLVSCISLGKGTDGIWRFAPNLNDIYYISGGGAGNVGVGTQTPQARLHVMDNLWVDSRGSAPSGPSMTLMGTTDDWVIANNYPGANRLDIGHQPHATGVTTPFMTILPNGNVGIGTTVPQSALQIGSGSPNSYLQITTESISAPAASACSQGAHVGRMVIWSPSTTDHRICFCPQNLGQGYGWKCAQGF